MTTSYKNGVFFFHTLYSSVMFLSSACSSAVLAAPSAAAAAASAAAALVATVPSAVDAVTAAAAAPEPAAGVSALPLPAAAALPLPSASKDGIVGTVVARVLVLRKVGRRVRRGLMGVQKQRDRRYEKTRNNRVDFSGR